MTPEQREQRRLQEKARLDKFKGELARVKDLAAEGIELPGFAAVKLCEIFFILCVQVEQFIADHEHGD